MPVFEEVDANYCTDSSFKWLDHNNLTIEPFNNLSGTQGKMPLELRFRRRIV